MSRFADEALTKTVSLGPCQCPGSPHEQDEAICHAQLGYGARVAAQIAGQQPNGTFSMQAAKMALLELFVISWNLLGPDGKAVEPGAAALGRLDPATIDALDAATEGVLTRADLPKASAGRSANGSPASGSRTPKTTDRTPSTSTSS